LPSGAARVIFHRQFLYAAPDKIRARRLLLPLVKDGTVLPPLRPMLEAIGATVSWDSASQTVTVRKPGTEIRLTVGRPTFTINGEIKPLDVAPEFYHSSIAIPVRILFEALGAYVQWAPEKHSVVITYGARPSSVVSNSPSAPPSVPTATPGPISTGTPTPTPSATPAGLNLPPLTYRVVPTQPASPAPGAPQILEIDFNSETITSTIAMRVLTNDVVTKVIANSGGHSGALTMVAPGRFEAMQGKLPRLGVLSVKVSVTFTAYSADGRTATAAVTLKKK
jgi:hypothetical protein